MAKILYGVAGEGSGHSSRAKEIISYMESKGHIVKVVSYDKGYKNLKPFFDVEEISGLGFVYKDNKVQPFQTFLKNISDSPKVAKSISKVSKIADEFKPDIIFSDFEPVSGIVANLKKTPLISIDNQHRLTNTKIEYPSKYRIDAEVAKAVTRMMLFNTKACLVIDFCVGEIINKKTFLFPPILRKEVLDLKTKTRNKKFILVYLTSPFKGLLDTLKSINKNFIVYGFNEDRVDGNLTFKKASSEGFLKDLTDCEGNCR